MATNNATDNQSVGTTDESHISHHIEHPRHGGARYVRCDVCGRETVRGVDNLVHTPDCPHRER